MIKNIIIIAVIALIVGGALAYIIKAKKSGKKCIGCPYGDSCKGSCCSCEKEEEK
ncbi:MAG: FeoB-associated Cys-rich membrane protein [Ruminococcaceae bacterium]|nr:FeoB-associated Cys-rich membrane protein [Oscillospiraceae bacterium]